MQLPNVIIILLKVVLQRNLVSSKKKTRRAPGVERPAFVKSEMGMFYLKNPAMMKGSVFPKELAVTLCADYTRKGCECNAENCTNAHPCQQGTLKNQT